MKPNNLLSPALLGLTFGALSAVAAAQVPLPAPGAPPLPPGYSAPAGVAVQPAPAEKPAGVVEKFTISDANLGQVVATLQHQLSERKLPRLNILIAPGAENFPVPPVELFNVTGQDALVLIAAAAGLEAKPIQAVEPAQAAGGGLPPKPKIIGYRIEKKVDPQAEQAKARKDAVEQVDVVVSKNLGAEKPTVRVYPLNDIIKGGPVDQLRQSIHDILEMSDVDYSQVKISFHEKTNLLVVRGSASVHRTISELLEALEKNLIPTMPSHLPQPVKEDAPSPAIPGGGATAPAEQH
ncbi:MAG: hypothetical protein ACO1QR_03095 [Chthoniobacteraceae bacterium]